MLSRFEYFMYTQQKIEHMYCEIYILRSAIINPKGSKQQYIVYALGPKYLLRTYYICTWTLWE